MKTTSTDDYRGHTSCMTEVERYEKRGPVKRKGPQEDWMELLAEAVPQAPVHLRPHLSEISTRDNVPRKEKQFRNFVANSMKISNSVVQQIWIFLKELKDKKQAAKDAQKKTNENQAKKNEPAKVEKAEEKDTAKSPSQNNDKTKIEASTTLPSADEVKKAMKKILKKESNKQMPLKKLRKAVCARYGIEKKGKDHMKKVVEKHLSGKKFVIDNKVVRLKID
eukprot:scaffold804_cov165-Amphora_coffeaeformis.AAC.24